jgi:hypothetical protein
MNGWFMPGSGEPGWALPGCSVRVPAMFFSSKDHMDWVLGWNWQIGWIAARDGVTEIGLRGDAFSTELEKVAEVLQAGNNGHGRDLFSGAKEDHTTCP